MNMMVRHTPKNLHFWRQWCIFFQEWAMFFFIMVTNQHILLVTCNMYIRWSQFRFDDHPRGHGRILVQGSRGSSGMVKNSSFSAFLVVAILWVPPLGKSWKFVNVLDEYAFQDYPAIYFCVIRFISDVFCWSQTTSRCFAGFRWVMWVARTSFRLCPTCALNPVAAAMLYGEEIVRTLASSATATEPDSSATTHDHDHDPVTGAVAW